MGGDGQPRQFISELSDELYNANARFSVTPGNLGFLFTNEPNQSNWGIAAGTAGTITINLTSKGEVATSGVGYPGGYVYVSFYGYSIAASVTGAGHVCERDRTAAIGSFTNISTMSGLAVFQGYVPATNYVTQIQLTITAPPTTATSVAKIEYHRGLADDQLPIAAVTKYGINKLYGTLYFQDTGNINRAYITPTGTGFLSTQLGIGTASPTAQLHTTGTVRFAGLTNDNTQARLLVSDTNGNILYRNVSTLPGASTGWALAGNSAINAATTFLGTTDTSSVAVRTNNLERMRVAGNGNVLIGKTTQVNTGYVLDVNGSARINLVVVNSTGADFVFDPGYRLSPLVQVEKYIRANHHLPDIAPAADMQAQGMDVGANQTALLKKVEELTLYLIREDKSLSAENKQIVEQQEQLSEQRARLDAQQKEIDELKGMIYKKGK